MNLRVGQLLINYSTEPPVLQRPEGSTVGNVLGRLSVPQHEIFLSRFTAYITNCLR
jgi:hypothetical protein